MNNWQRQIVVGSILGGSSLVRARRGVNYFLSMAHRNPEWLRYKMTELGDVYFPKSNLSLDKRTYRCASCCCESLTALREEIYRDGNRQITPRILDPLRDIALAVWFIDGGGMTGRGLQNAYLNLTRMPESADAIRDYFCDLSMFCRIKPTTGRIRLVFTVPGTDNLLRVIAHRVPDFMHHRL